MEKKFLKKKEFLSKVDGTYLDRRKDATLTLLTDSNRKQYHGCTIEEHYVVVREPIIDSLCT